MGEIVLARPLEYGGRVHHAIAESGFPFKGTMSLYRHIRSLAREGLRVSSEPHRDLVNEAQAYLIRGWDRYEHDRYFAALEDVDEAWRIYRSLEQSLPDHVGVTTVRTALEAIQQRLVGEHALHANRIGFARFMFERAYETTKKQVAAFRTEYLVKGNFIADQVADRLEAWVPSLEHIVRVFNANPPNALEVVPVSDRPYSLRKQQRLSRMLAEGRFMDSGFDTEIARYMDLCAAEQRLSDQLHEYLLPPVASTVTDIVAELLPFALHDSPTVVLDYDEVRVYPNKACRQVLFAVPAEEELQIFLSGYGVSRGVDALLMDFLLSPEVVLAHQRSAVAVHYPEKTGSHSLFPPA